MHNLVESGMHHVKIKGCPDALHYLPVQDGAKKRRSSVNKNLAELIHTAKQGPVHLRFDSGKVLITPEDHPRFEMAAKRAVDVLHQMRSVDEVRRQFNEHYLPFLHAWCEKHADRVKACYLGSPTPYGLSVFVVAQTDDYDFSLGRHISEFALTLEREGWSSNILQIPDGEEDDLFTFFDPEESLQVYHAQCEAARCQIEA